MNKNTLKSIVESLLFINERPIEINELTSILELDKKEIIVVLEELALEYSERKSGICIVKVAGGYQMCSSPESEPWVKKMYRDRNKQKLSTASLETLAIIAYKQPITRIEIESIRGVNADGMLRKLVELGLIKIGGRKDVVGKPFLYITTRKFLEYFGINFLKDLPKLEDFVALAEKEKILEPSEGEKPLVQDHFENQDGIVFGEGQDAQGENNPLPSGKEETLPRETEGDNSHFRVNESFSERLSLEGENIDKEVEE